jgi:hypothetical protein
MDLANLVYALSIAKLHPVLAGAALVAFILLAAGWGLRWGLMLRRRRERPLALIVADAIAQGSVHDMSAPPPQRDAPSVEMAAAGRARLRLTAYQKLEESESNWGFSLREAGNLVATFVYPGQEEARAAHKAMRRALKDLTMVLQPAKTPLRRSELDPADFRPQRVWAERPESAEAAEFAPAARSPAPF